jgi:hypothetical protein
MDLKNFGQKLKFEESNKSKEKKIKELFMSIVDTLEYKFHSSTALFTEFNIEIFRYEEDYYKIIENLLLLHFGLWKTELILWYVYEGKDENGVPNSIDIELPTGETQTMKFSTTSSLWNFMTKLDKQLNKQ